FRVPLSSRWINCCDADGIDGVFAFSGRADRASRSCIHYFDADLSAYAKRPTAGGGRLLPRGDETARDGGVRVSDAGWTEGLVDAVGRSRVDRAGQGTAETDPAASEVLLPDFAE